MNTKSKKIRNLFLSLGVVAAAVGGMTLNAAETSGSTTQKLPEITLQPNAPGAEKKPAIAPETVVLKINGQEIKQAQVDEMANTMIQAFVRQMGGQMMPGGLPPELMENARNEAYRRLAQKTLVDQAMKEDKIAEPTDAQIKAEMDRYDAVIRSNSTTETLASQLAEAKKEIPDVEKKFKDDLKNVLKQIALVEKECGVKIDPTDAELKAKFEKNPEQYKKVRASHILIRTEPKEGTAVTVDKEALDKAKSVEKEAKDGKDFSELAKKYSADEAANKQGGDLGFFTKDKMVKEFSDAAFKMKKGEISGPVKTQFGYHIIKVTDIKAPSFETAKAMIFMEDRSEKMEKSFPEAMEKIQKRAKIEDLRPKTEAPKAPADAPTEAPAPEKKADKK